LAWVCSRLVLCGEYFASWDIYRRQAAMAPMMKSDADLARHVQDAFRHDYVNGLFGIPLRPALRDLS